MQDSCQHYFSLLYQLLKKDEKWAWTSSHEKSFQEDKRLVCEGVTLVHYDVEKPVRVYCDASSYGVGACLMHVIGGQEKPIAYASRTLSQAEMKYAQIEREALAIIFAVKNSISMYMVESLCWLQTINYCAPLLGMIKVFQH